MVGDEVALSLTHAGVPLSGSIRVAIDCVASVVLFNASRIPAWRVLGPGAVFTATYSVVPSGESAGAQFIATCAIETFAAAALALTHVPVPSGATRAMPLASPAGFAPVTRKPKYTLPAASAVSGVLMRTVLS